MNDENVNPMMGTNMRIAEILASKYGSDNPETLYVLLSDPAFIHDIKKLREHYGIKLVDKKTSDVSAQQYIADCVARKMNRSIRNQDDFEQCYGEFNAELVSICEKHRIPKLPIDLMDQYVCRGDAFLSQQHAHNLIKVSLNKHTKELTIKMSPITKKRDLQDVLTTIYQSWDEQRGKQPKRQPTTAANVHSQIVRHSQSATEKETAEKFGQTEENVHKIKMRVRNQRKKLLRNNESEGQQ